MKDLMENPLYFRNSCIEFINEDIQNENKRARRAEAQRVINKMKGR